MPKHLTSNDTASFVTAVNIGAANGVAGLGSDGKVPITQLPAAVSGGVNSVDGRIGNIDLSDRYVGVDSQTINVKDHGAQGDDTTDDTTAINSAITACPPGGVVYFPAGSYRTSSPIVVPPGKTLMGSHTNHMKVVGLYDPNCCIKPLASFTGVAAIVFLDQATGGYAAISGEQRILNLMINGSAAPAGVDGIQAKGNIQNIGLRDVTIRDMTGNGIYTGVNAGAYPYSWRMFRVMLDTNHGHGMSVQQMTDLTMVDCQAIGNFANGFVLNNMANSQINSCRAEWNGNHGYYLTGSWGTGQGSGGMQMSGCSTDRNGFHGVFVDATGNGPIVISNLQTRRDGRNGNAGGGGYAGLAAIASTIPLTIGDWIQYPGTDDNGTGTNSPQYGGSFANNTFVQIDNAYLHANTAGLNNGGGNTTLQLGTNITYATGATTAPVRTVQQNYVKAGSLVLNVKDYGAKGDGTTDDTTAIQAALTACPAGGVVYMPLGVYRTSAPVTIPPFVTLKGTHGGGEAQSTSSPMPSAIKPLVGFTGAAVIQMLDQQLGGYATLASEMAVFDLTVDGSALSGGTTAGIQMKGQIQHITMRDVQVRKVPGNAFDTAYNLSAPPGPQAPFCLHLDRVSALWAGGTGFALNNTTDSTYIDCYALGCSSWGWYIAGCNGGTWLACRAEWCGTDGFYLATNNAVQTFIGCSTDRNGQNGFSVPASTSTGPIVLSGCRMTRDGRTSTGAGYAGLNVSGNTVRKVLADNLLITTGRDDDGTSGNLSPQYGVSATNSVYVSVASGDLNGVSAGWRDGGGNTTFVNGPTVTGSGITRGAMGGDLSGSYPNPTVAKVNGVTVTGTPATGQAITATSSTTATWQTPAAGVTLDSTSTDIQPLGTQAAGAKGQAADAGHVHPMPKLNELSAPIAAVNHGNQKITSLANGTAATDGAAFGQIPLPGITAGTYAAGNDGRITGALQGGTSAGGDLSGTLPSPAVARINGTSVPATPTSGQVLTATSGTAATWQALPAAAAGATGVVQLANDLGGTATAPQVVQTHLAAALPIAQGGTGGTTAALARTALNVIAMDSQTINVKDHGVVGDGVTDDYAALNTIISTAAVGSTIYFPKGTYIVGTLLTLYSGLTYIGSNVDNTIIKMKNATNLAAVAATVGWAGSTAGSSVDPVHIRNITFDGNKANQTSGAGHGVVLQTYYATVENVNFQNTRGDGLRFDAYGANGTTAISNTMVENWVQRIQCRNNGGSGFVVNDTSHNKATDGWLKHAIVDTPGANAIWIGAGAGWTIDGCHTYNVPQSAIRVDRAFETRIVNNYVESCGASATLGTYALIDCINFGAQDNGQGSSISNNTIYYQGPAGNAGSTIAGIAFQSANGGSANVSITGNQIFCTGQSNLSAIWLQNQSSTATLTAKVSGNNLVGWTTNVQQVPNGGSLIASGDNIPLADLNVFEPSDQGLIAWTMRPESCGASGTSLTAGFIYLFEIILRQPATLAKINLVIGTAGATLTSGQNLFGLYDTTGTRRALSADMSTTWNSVGNKTANFSSSYVAAPGKYYVAMLFNGTTSPVFAAGSTFGATFTPGNANLSAGNYRFCRSAANGNTSLPASVTLSGYTPDANNVYVGVG